MDKYLKEKLPKADTTKAEDYLEETRRIRRELNMAPAPSMVDDFQKPLVKDIPREKIKTLGEIQPIKPASEHMANEIIRKAAVEQVGDSLDYLKPKKVKDTSEYLYDAGKYLKEFKDKARLAARSTVGRKVLGAVPLLGGLASAAMSGDASAAVPLLDSAESLGPEAGSLEYRMENGLLTDQDKQQLALEQARMRALQTIGR